MSTNLLRNLAFLVIVTPLSSVGPVQAQTDEIVAASSDTNAVPVAATERAQPEQPASTNAASSAAVEPAPAPQPTTAGAVSAAATLETPPPATGELSREEMLKRLQELTEEMRIMRQELNQMEAERAAQAAERERARAATAGPPATPAPGPAVEAPAPAAQPAPEEKPQVDEEQARIERERAIRSVQRSGVLLKRGSVEVEPSITYSHFSSNLIDVEGFTILPVLVLGQIESLRIERDVYQPTLSLRYGIINNLQGDVTASYRFEEDRFVRQVQSQPRTEQTITDEGVGDLQFGLSRQVLYEHGVVPDMILSARASAPIGKSQFDFGSTNATPNELAMGSGVWSLRTGVTVIKTLDPAVLIFNAGYTMSFGRDFTVFTNEFTETATNTVAVPTTYEPGNTFDYSIAIAMALNPVLAINLQVQQRISDSTNLPHFGRIEGSRTNEADLRFGFAWALTQRAMLNFTAAAGLTEDTPDLLVSLSMPIRF